MMTHSLYPESQSSYRKFHSGETALVKVMNDILLKINSQEVTLLVMLDWNAAFDAVDHDFLIEHLDKGVAIQGKALV